MSVKEEDQQLSKIPPGHIGATVKYKSFLLRLIFQGFFLYSEIYMKLQSYFCDYILPMLLNKAFHVKNQYKQKETLCISPEGQAAITDPSPLDKIPVLV